LHRLASDATVWTRHSAGWSARRDRMTTRTNDSWIASAWRGFCNLAPLALVIGCVLQWHWVLLGIVRAAEWVAGVTQ